MDAFFDKKSNILNTQIRAKYDDSVLYSVRTSSGFRGRKITILHDANPVWASSPIVGAIYWREKTLEVFGHKKRIGEVKKHQGRFYARTRVWRWSEARTPYRIKYRGGKWTVTNNKDNDLNPESLGTFTVPSQPQLFGKVPSTTLYLSPNALSDDEVFLILMFIYSETRRRDKNACYRSLLSGPRNTDTVA